ncbi:MAG: trigger factor [Rhodospirillaceae bacterium]
MQITETSADGLKHEFKIVIAAQEIDAKVQAKLLELSRTVKLPGFRPGKVPAKVLAQRYGASVVQDVVEHEVGEGARRATTERGLRPAVAPNFDVPPYVEGQDLEFTLGIEVLPDIEPGDFGTIELERPVAEVDEASIAKMLTSLADYAKSSEPVTEERAAVEGDILVIDFAGTVDGEAKEGMKAEGHELPLGEKTFLPDFENGLIGARAGEHRRLEVGFPADYQAAELAGKVAVFEIDVKELRRPVPGAVDDALAQRFGLDTLAALEDSARARLTAEYTALSRRRVKRALLDKLADLHTFPVPPSMVEVEFEAVWNQWQCEKQAGRIDAAEAGRDEEEVKAEYRAIAERRVRLGLLLSEVGRRNNIKVSQEELNRALVAEARRYPGHEREILDLFRKNDEAVDRLRAPLYEEKTIDFILELVRVSDRTVSIEELRRDPDDGDSA